MSHIHVRQIDGKMHKFCDISDIGHECLTRIEDISDVHGNIDALSRINDSHGNSDALTRIDDVSDMYG